LSAIEKHSSLFLQLISQGLQITTIKSFNNLKKLNILNCLKIHKDIKKQEVHAVAAVVDDDGVVVAVTVAVAVAVVVVFNVSQQFHSQQPPECQPATATLRPLPSAAADAPADVATTPATTLRRTAFESPPRRQNRPPRFRTVAVKRKFLSVKLKRFKT
jgi:hypothetical protein